MSVRVVHPLHLRIDAARLGEDDLLRAALDAALTRALAGSSHHVLAALPDGTGIRVVPPRFDWDAAGQVGAEDRSRLEDLVSAAVADASTTALRRAGVSDGVLFRGSSTGLDVEEPVDRSRYSRGQGRYVVPAYGGSPHRSVPILEDDGPGFTVTSVPAERLWTPLARDTILAAIDDALARSGGGLPATGLVGFVFLGVDGRTYLVAQEPDGTLRDPFPFGPILETYVTDLGEFAQRPVPLSPEATYRLRWEGGGADGPVVVRRFHGARLRTAAKAVIAQLPLQSDAEYADALQARVEPALTRMAGAADAAGCFLRLDVDGLGQLLHLSPPYPDWVVAGLDLVVLPLTKPGERPSGSTRLGDRAGDGAGHAPGRGLGQAAAKKEAAGGAGGTSTEPGGFVTDPGEQTAPAGKRNFPLGSPWSSRTVQVCAAVEGEPKLEALGPAAAPLKELMDRICTALEIQPCAYVGSFVVEAGRFVGVRAQQVASDPEQTAGRNEAPPPGVQGNLGSVHFTAAASVHVQLQRHLAATVPLIDQLAQAYQDVLRERPGLIEGTWHDRYVSWQLRFGSEYVNSLSRGVGELFAMTCGVLFGQLLRGSRRVMDDARFNVDRTAKVFEQRILPQLVDIAELLRWRDDLKSTRLNASFANSGEGFQPEEVVIAPEVPMPAARKGGSSQRDAWAAAAGAFTTGLAPAPARSDAAGTGRAGEVVHAGGSYRVRDHSGRLLSLDELEQSITLRRGGVESTDPLVSHLDDLPATVGRMQGGTDHVKRELIAVLARMQESSDDIMAQAAADVWYGFRASGISENIPQATVPGSKYALGGIHQLAHAQLADFFRGSRYYAIGIDDVMDTELGRKGLTQAIEFIGIVALSVLCPPAGIVLGIEVAAYHLAEAYEKQSVYDALWEPTQVLSRAEVELELFGAWFGFIVSLLPAAGKALGALGKALRPLAAAAEEAGAASRAVSAEAADAAVSAWLREVEVDLVEQFITELVKGELLNKLVEVVMTPVMEHLQRELEVTAAVGGIDAAMQTVLARQIAAAKGGRP